MNEKLIEELKTLRDGFEQDLEVIRQMTVEPDIALGYADAKVTTAVQVATINKAIAALSAKPEPLPEVDSWIFAHSEPLLGVGIVVPQSAVLELVAKLTDAHKAAMAACESDWGNLVDALNDKVAAHATEKAALLESIEGFKELQAEEYNRTEDQLVAMELRIAEAKEHGRREALMGVPKISNEMKAEHIGEYSFKHKVSCCGGDLEGCDGDECDCCDGSGLIEDDLIVPWDTCKTIFKGMFQTYARAAQAGHNNGGNK